MEEEFLVKIEQCNTEIARWTEIKRVATLKLYETRRERQELVYTLFYEAESTNKCDDHKFSGSVGLFSSYENAKKFLPEKVRRSDYSYSYKIEVKESRDVSPHNFSILDQKPKFPHEEWDL